MANALLPSKPLLLCLWSLFFFACSASTGPAITLEDQSGYSLTLSSPPQRIISTAPSNTEMLFALGLGKNMVAVTTRCDFPAAAKQLPKIGDLFFNYEKIVTLKPDLIVAQGELQKQVIEKLRTLHLPVFVVEPHSLQELGEAFQKLGKLTGKEKEEAILSRQITQALARSKSKRRLPSPRVLVSYWRNPFMVFGRGTLVDDMLSQLGAINLGSAGRGAYPTINLEWILRENPDYLIFTDEALQQPMDLKNDPKWRKVKGVQENHVLILESALLSRPGPRSIQALEKIRVFLDKKNEK